MKIILKGKRYLALAMLMVMDGMDVHRLFGF